MVPSVTVSASVSPDGVFFTVNAELARADAAARASSKVITSVAPFTLAEANDGAVVSTPAARVTVTV